MPNDSWQLVHAERASLADDLETLTAEQWAAASLCADWNVHQMLGHMVATAKTNPLNFFGRFAQAGFRFHHFNARGVARETGAGPAATLAEFRAHLNDTSAPPGPADVVIGEVIIHSADIRRPLGISYTPPVDAVRKVADFYQGSNAIVGAKNRIAGLTLVATDSDWRHGTGPELHGPLLSLVQAMTGRGVAMADLSGDGVEVLRGRMG